MSSQNPGNLRAVAVNTLLFIAVVLFLSAAALAQNNPVPLIYQPLNPDKGQPGGSDFTVDVYGTGFASGAVLRWNGSPRITTVVNGRHLRARIEAADIANAGTGAISVSNPAPGGGASNVVYFPIRGNGGNVAFTRLDTPLSLLGAVTVGDFDNDGKPDVAVAQNQGNGGSNSILIYLGNGDGTFSNPVTNPTKKHYQPTALLASDFNGDGNLDLAVPDDLGNTAIFLGNGDGTFNQLAPFQTSPNGLFMAAADINQDGSLDLVTGGFGGGSFLADVFLGNGDGTFAHSQTLTTFAGIGNPALGDLDGDGTIDLALPDRDEVDVFRGNGDGTFQTAASYLTNLTSSSVAIADIDRRGSFDLVTNGLSLLLNGGDGTFGDRQDLAAGGSSYNIAVGDFNGDFLPDVALLDIRGNIANLDLFRSGDGKFNVVPDLASSGTAAGVGIGMADFNNDGFLDLVDTSNFGSPALSVFLQTTVRISKTNLTFGSRQVGSPSQAKTLTLTNIGSNVLNITNIGISGQNAGDFSQTNDCGSQLDPHKRCHIQVTFTPIDRGQRSASLNIVYDGLGSPLTVALSGTGVVLQLSLTPSSMTFDTQLVFTKSPAQVATLTNTGDDAAPINKISIAAEFLQTNDCPGTLNPGASCQIHVQFRPEERGPVEGQLVVSDGIPGGQTVALSGVGTVVKLSAKSIDFGNQQVGTTSPMVPFRLTNEGSKVLNISSIEIDGANAGDFAQTNNCGDHVGIGHSCTIMVTFTPTQKGPRTAAVTITSDGGGDPLGVALSGNGT